MAQKRRPRFRLATLEASTNPLKSIQAKRLVMTVKYVAGIVPKIISIDGTGVKTKQY